MKLIIQVNIGPSNLSKGDVLASLAFAFATINPHFGVGDSGYLRDDSGAKIGSWFVQPERVSQIDSFSARQRDPSRKDPDTGT